MSVASDYVPNVSTPAADPEVGPRFWSWREPITQQNVVLNFYAILNLLYMLQAAGHNVGLAHMVSSNLAHMKWPSKLLSLPKLLTAPQQEMPQV